MRFSISKSSPARLGFIVLTFLAQTNIASSQQSGTLKLYRGSIGGSHMEMRLKIEGSKVAGTYSYDRIGEELKLSGRRDDCGRLELAEFGGNGKQTGKIVCK